MNRTKVKNYAEILQDFDSITAVKFCKSASSSSVKVKGIKDNIEVQNVYSYMNISVAKFVAQKVSYFLNINLKD